MAVGPVTVVINNCNLCTWPAAMVERIERFDRLAEIIVVDNGSTYDPTLQWYERLPHRIIRLDNLGHKAPWSEEVRRAIRTDLYVVTDPDLDIADAPNDTLIHLAQCLSDFPGLLKVGLGLTFDDVPKESPYYKHVHSWEADFWKIPLEKGLVRLAPVDTTFALQDRRFLDEYRICGGRTDRPYVARHLPWSIVDNSPEFQYYLDNANTSSSYISFLKKAQFKRSIASQLNTRFKSFFRI